MELDKNEQDLVILTMIQANRRFHELDSVYAVRNAKQKFRSTQKDGFKLNVINFTFLSLHVCKSFFFFVHPIGINRYKSLLKHYDIHGLSPRAHKSAGKSAARENVLSKEDVEDIVNFIKKYTDKYGLPLPGRIPSCKNFEKAIKLSSADTKSVVYRKYCVAVDETPGKWKVCRTSFNDIWRKFLPHISCQKPATDLCDVCQQNVLCIQRAANIDDNDAEKTAALADAMDHIEKAKLQRDHYNMWRNKAKSQTETEFRGVKGKFQVLSFDFAEQIHYPSNPQQVGKSYFKTARKCGIFGVHDERTNIQSNYLIDENDNVGKGADVVISMLHDYLERNNDGGILILFADNCVGQNKNNAVIQYLNWRVRTGKNSAIEYNFMLAGHTKFSPDRSFGLVKILYRKMVVDCQSDFISCVTESSPNGFNIAIPTVDPFTNQRNVTWSKWTSFLDQFHKQLPAVLKFHHFSFLSNGSIEAKSFINDKVDNIFNLEVQSLETPDSAIIEDIIPEGMDAERQWYLCKDVCSFCADEKKKDEVAPMPNVPYKSYAKKRNAEKKENVIALPTEKKKRSRSTAPKKSTPKPTAKVASNKKK